MLTEDRPQFETLMDQLSAAYSQPSYDVRKEAFWKALTKMSIIQFSRVIDFCLSEDGPEKIPTAPAVWKLWRTVKDKARAQGPKAPIIDVPAPSKGLSLVNGLFLKYLARRRLKEEFKGDLHVAERRAACRSLAEWYDGCALEDMAPQPDELARSFEIEMARQYPRSVLA